MPKILVFTGAGLSAESGIKTFRDADGLWENHKIEEVCDYNTWFHNYNLIHKFYDERRMSLKDIVPNKAHEMITKWSNEYEIINITTNVDDLCERAGNNPLHLHGNLTEIKCMDCEMISDIGYHSKDEAVNLGLVKHKLTCKDKTILKPNVVFFNEMSPNYILFNDNITELTKDDIIVVIGASLVVVPIHFYTEKIDCFKININPNLQIKDVGEWFNIKEGAVSGIKVADNIIKEYMKAFK